MESLQRRILSDTLLAARASPLTFVRELPRRLLTASLYAEKSTGLICYFVAFKNRKLKFGRHRDSWWDNVTFIKNFLVSYCFLQLLAVAW